MTKMQASRAAKSFIGPGLAVLLLSVAAAGCGSDPGTATGTGGRGSGGTNAGSGGSMGTGVTGGSTGSGGVSGTGGAATGGSGSDGTGGVASGSGGNSAGSGGQPGSGGATATSTGGAASGGAGGTAVATGGGGGQATGGQLGSGGTAGTAAPGGRGGGPPAGGAGGGNAPAFDRAAVRSVMRRVADYEIARFANNNSNGWIRATFHTGMLAAYRALGDVKYRDYTRQWGQANSWRVSTVDGNGPRFADNQTCFQSYAELYLENPVASNNVLLSSAQTVLDSMVAMPMAGRTEWWWCDALFMAPPAMVRLAQATGKQQYITLMHTMFWDTKAFLFDPVNNLFWRDSKYRNMNVFWSRGNGWVVGGIARVLEYLPANDPRRPDYENLLRLMTTKLRSIQGADGFWRSGLTTPNEFPNPESSGTAFFCFGMAWGINNGVLDRATFLPTVTKAWNALVSAVNAQGRLGWVQRVGERPGDTTVDFTNDYATGAFLLAGAEVLKL